jgi:hypothetical protein
MPIEWELRITRSITQRDRLARFFKSQSRWELLLLVASRNEDDDIGIWNYIDMLATRTESQMTIYNFIKDRIDDGSFILVSGRKKSRKVIALSVDLRVALDQYLMIRYGDCHSPEFPLCQGSCPLLHFSSISQVGGIGR